MFSTEAAREAFVFIIIVSSRSRSGCLVVSGSELMCLYVGCGICVVSHVQRIIINCNIGVEMRRERREKNTRCKHFDADNCLHCVRVLFVCGLCTYIMHVILLYALTSKCFCRVCPIVRVIDGEQHPLTLTSSACFVAYIST